MEIIFPLITDLAASHNTEEETQLALFKVKYSVKSFFISRRSGGSVRSETFSLQYLKCSSDPRQILMITGLWSESLINTILLSFTWNRSFFKVQKKSILEYVPCTSLYYSVTNSKAICWLAMTVIQTQCCFAHKPKCYLCFTKSVKVLLWFTSLAT